MLTNALNPNVVKTFLDDVFYSDWDVALHPQYADVTDSMIFRQESSALAQETFEEFAGPGLLQETGELVNFPDAQPTFGNTVVFVNTKYARSVTISGEFFDDSKFMAIENMVRELAVNAKQTQRQQAFSLYNNGFTTAVGGDGVSLFNAAHPLLSGGTQDNVSADALADSSLNDAIIALVNQKKQDGVNAGQMPACLLVPPALYKLAVELTEAELTPASADNDPNVFSTKYGISVKQSPFLGAAYGGSDTAWFLLAKSHGVLRLIRKGIETTMIDRAISINDSYVYKASYRESVGYQSHLGTYGSTGV